MPGEYDRLRHLLLQTENARLDELDASLQRTAARFADVPDLLAEDIRQSLRDGNPSRLSEALAEATTGSLEIAVRRRPQSVVNAVYPVIGPAIRRSLGETMRQMADELDRALVDTLSLRSLWWRFESWRTGMPYAQVVLRHTTQYQVEHLYLIEPRSGLLLGHLAAAGLPGLDADAIAGMFTAIHQFVRDSVSPGGIEGGIGSATVGEYRLVVSEGPDALLVAFVRGLTSRDFQARLDELNEELHARHGSLLADPAQWGHAGDGFLERSQFDELNREGRGVAPGRDHRRHLYALLAILLVAGAIHVGLGVRWSLQSREMQERLSAMPGLVIAKWGDDRRGKLRIEGLLDPAANGPQAWVAEHYPAVEVDWRLRPFVSLEPVMVQRRVARQTGLSPGLVRFSDGVAIIEGSVPFALWFRATSAPVRVPGVDRVDASGLVYPGRARIERLIAELQGVQLRFDSGTASPSHGMDRDIGVMLDRLRALQDAGAEQGIAFRLRTLGFTDEPGSYVQNRDLRQARAEWLAAELLGMLRPPSTVTIDQDVVYTLPNATVRATTVVITPFPSKP